MAKKTNIITPEIVDDVTESSKELVSPFAVKPDRLTIIPVFRRPYFPAQVQPVVVSLDKAGKAIEQIEKTDHRLLGLTYAGDKPEGELSGDDLAVTGCVVKMHNVVKEKGVIQFVAEGVQRFKIDKIVNNSIPFIADVTYIDEELEDPERVKAYAMAIINNIKELLPLNPLYSEGLKDYLTRFSPNDPSPLADFAATLTTAGGNELQEILDTASVLKRMEKVLVLLKKELETVKLQGEISEEVNKKMSEHQRKFFLKEQLKVIQKELGISKDDRTADIEMFTDRMGNLDAPDHALERFEAEIDKLSVLEKSSSEYGVVRNYLDWITSVPWGKFSEDKFDIREAETSLNKHHAGLEDVKKNILEFLALGIFKKEVSGAIMLLVGPPGVGKTSIGKSIAEALGRKFYRFSLGGMRDEAEIKGHRRTYVGAMPGKFMQALRETGVSNPVIMLDEVDKIGSSYQGDPASALLEVLDPEQNSSFLDHYFDLRFDLSKVLFICTANQLDTIPGPLLDRMDVTRLAGYITDEKIEIGRKHVWPKLLKNTGIKAKQLQITDAAIRMMAEGYARDAGVRSLEKNMDKIKRKVVVQLLENPDAKVRIGVKNLSDYLGPPLFRKDKKMSGIGVVTGLAWTAMGGATLSIEAVKVHSKSKGFKLTGKLGEVMQESASIAYSYIAGNLKHYKGDPEFFDTAAIHLHVPEGATPKDGPSAGITMATALLSLAKGKAPAADIAMTGELSLTGNVLPVGGIREKIIAAKRRGIKTLIIPADNQRDFDELPDYLKENITVHFAETFETVYRHIGL